MDFIRAAVGSATAAVNLNNEGNLNYLIVFDFHVSLVEVFSNLLFFVFPMNK